MANGLVIRQRYARQVCSRSRGNFSPRVAIAHAKLGRRAVRVSRDENGNDEIHRVRSRACSRWATRTDEREIA